MIDRACRETIDLWNQSAYGFLPGKFKVVYKNSAKPFKLVYFSELIVGGCLVCSAESARALPPPVTIC